MSDISHIIPMGVAPDKSMKISEIVCSPNLKYVAALYEDDNINLWPIEQPDKIINIGKIHKTKNGEKIFAISDKYISFSLYRDQPYNFKILDFENEKEVLLKFPDWQKEIDYLSFIDNGNVIMVNAKYYRAYVFSIDDNISWACKLCKSMIELKYFKKIYITLKGKLIIFNDTIYEITMWDVEELSIKTRILIDWDFTPESIEISDDEELLIICARNEKTKDTNLYIFSTETGINLSFFTTKLVINRIHLITSRKGERLLYITSENDYNLMDPYSLKYPKDASELFERNEIPIQEPYIIRSDERSDKIIYTINGRVLIEELLPDNWIKYLRKELKDTNRITTLSKKTIDIIAEIIDNKLTDDYNVDREFEGEYLKWGLELDDKSVRLTVIDYNHRKKKWSPDDKKKHLDILPSFYPNGKIFILSCEVLENDDFITITRIGVIIWTYRNSEIKMHYYWNYWNNRLEGFEFERIKFKSLLKDWIPRRILPASNYETIYKNLDIKFGKEADKEAKKLFETFLEDNIREEFYLTCYGKILMETLIKLKDDKWIRYLGGSCIDKCMQDNNHLISKISLLSIIFENFNELSENHPAFIASTLSSIGFVVPSNIVTPNSNSPHLSSYGKYCHLSKTSFIDILTSNLWIHWISFQQSFQTNFEKFQESHPFFRKFIINPINEFIVNPIIGFYYVGNTSTILAIPLPNFVSYSKDYNLWKELVLPVSNSFTSSNKVEHVIDIVQNNNWSGYKKPYVSKNLNEVLLLPEEEPSLTDIECAIKKTETSLKRIEKTIKELKESINSS
ncbi:9678_t:CDS:2 [Cetraspora pellucida]|uniref:9678_t:CDS:1 n=1 Tax=Cetraspora pellucida TaxID=1433469 RepID=A0A9N9FFA1_9GLOM|nr:9678_t:CDS:2 [Cetraspora pellucida]